MREKMDQGRLLVAMTTFRFGPWERKILCAIVYKVIVA